jgi:hypothetical protein
MSENHDEVFYVRPVQHSITGGMFIEVTPQMQRLLPVKLGTRLKVSKTLVDSGPEWKEAIIIEVEDV